MGRARRKRRREVCFHKPMEERYYEGRRVQFTPPTPRELVHSGSRLQIGVWEVRPCLVTRIYPATPQNFEC